MQETKLADDDAPRDAVPDGRLRARPPRRGPLERRRDRQQGTAIDDVDHELRRRAGPRLSAGAATPSARTTSTRSTRPGWCPRSAAASGSSSLYAPNGRVVGSPFYDGKLRWFERLERWLDETQDARPSRSSSVATSTSRPPRRRLGRVKAHGGTHVSRARARGARRPPGAGPERRLSHPPARPRPLLVVGLPRRDVPPQRGHAHRPAVRHEAGGEAHRVGRDRPRGTQGPTDAVRPRAGRRRSRRARASRSKPAGTARCAGSPRGRSPSRTAAPRRSATRRSSTRSVERAADALPPVPAVPPDEVAVSSPGTPHPRAVGAAQGRRS